MKSSYIKKYSESFKIILVFFLILPLNVVAQTDVENQGQVEQQRSILNKLKAKMILEDSSSGKMKESLSKLKQVLKSLPQSDSVKQQLKNIETLEAPVKNPIHIIENGEPVLLAEDIQKQILELNNNPLVKKANQLITAKGFLEKVQNLIKSDKKKTIFITQVILFILMLILREWWLSGVEHWFKKFGIRIICFWSFFGIATIVVPIYFLGDDYIDIMSTVFGVISS